MTAKLLKDLLKMAKTGSKTIRHTANLTAGAFFFAMRGGEFSKAERPGKTTPIEVRDVTFWDNKKSQLDRSSPGWENRAVYVRITFRQQKNGTKKETRAQARSGDKSFCPVRLWIKIVKAADPTGKHKRRKVFSLDSGGGQIAIRTKDVVKLMRTVGRATKSRHPSIDVEKLGARSIRSGAAMALFLAGHHPERIKILGRWKSEAFLVYIRPQILEWTNLMARDMARNNKPTKPKPRRPRPTEEDMEFPALL